MDTVRYAIDRELAPLHEAEVIVVGGGPGGIGAAVMAGREGARTLLIERYACLGGMATLGEVHPFMPNHVNGACLDRPVYLEWLERIRAYYPTDWSDPQAVEQRSRQISKEAAMLAAEDLCLEAGVELLYHHQLADVIVREGAIDALVLLSKSGFTAARAKVYVDATGDADLAARAGCGFEQGGPSGHCQPMTLCFKLSHVDRSRMPDRKTITQLYEQAKAQGAIQCPREDVLWFEWMDGDVIHFNTTRVIHKAGTDGQQLSEAEIEGRRQLRQFVTFLRQRVAGFENARLHSIAHHIGVRETRRVRGLAYVTKEDYLACRKYPDAIARVRYAIDIHNPDGGGTERLNLPHGEWYEIPYGSIVARDARNLLIGGRPISVDHAVHSSMRVMPPACSVGQAAGLAAAMAAREGRNPRDLDGTRVREKLKARGASL